ncbi:MAG: anaerobic ribonucleoside-triphosphate reductase [Candidatus Hydrothermarchaeota archaeon]
MGDKIIRVVCSDGKIERFDPNRITEECIESGIPFWTAAEVALDVSGRIYDGISTKEIRAMTTELLYKKDPEAARRYERYHKMRVRTTRNIIEGFDRRKIVLSLISETGMSQEMAEKIAKEVEEELRRLKLEFLSAPLIREVVNAKLLEYGLEKERADYTRLGLPVYDVTKLIELGSKENTNLQHNAETIHKLAGDSVFEQYCLLKILPRDIADAHMRGLIHIHNLNYWAVRPNSMQHDLRWFLKFGLRVDGNGIYASVSSPPRHIETAILQASKVLMTSQTQMTGGQGFDFFNVFLAPFLRGLTHEQIKQAAQMFVYEMNQHHIARGGVLFSNLDLELQVPKFLEKEPAILPGGALGDTYADYEDEARLFLTALIDVLLEGDHTGKPHLFPNIVFKIRKDSFRQENEEMLLKIHQLIAKFGTPYIANLCPEWQSNQVNYMACRSRLDAGWKEDWETDTMRTGNLHQITINLPRLAYEANGDDERLYELLWDRCEMIYEALSNIKHKIIERRLYQDRVLPFLSQELNGETYYRIEDTTHTIGYIGLNEMLIAHTGHSLHEDKSSWKFGVEFIKYLATVILPEFVDRSGHRWCISQTPAEHSTYRLAMLDLREFGERAVFKGTMDSPYYSNSSHTSVDADISLSEKIKLEEPFHPLSSGGHMFHVFLGEKPSVDSLISMTEKLCKNSELGFFAYTRDLTICNHCQNISAGLLERCPKCGATGKVLDHYSRITGYYKRLDDWNRGKRQELRDRSKHWIGH